MSEVGRGFSPALFILNFQKHSPGVIFNWKEDSGES